MSALGSLVHLGLRDMHDQNLIHAIRLACPFKHKDFHVVEGGISHNGKNLAAKWLKQLVNIGSNLRQSTRPRGVKSSLNLGCQRFCICHSHTLANSARRAN